MINSIVSLIVFILVGHGLTYIVTSSSLLQEVRDYVIMKSHVKIGELITCPYCFATHAGFFLSLVANLAGGVTPSYYIVGGSSILINIILDGIIMTGAERLINKEKSW